VRLIGSEGVMELGWDTITIRRSKMSAAPGYGGWDSFNTFSEAQQKEYAAWYKSQYPERPVMSEPGEMEYKTPQGYSDHYDHHAYFFKAVREGGSVVEDTSFGLRAAGPALATNLSYFEQKVVNWDPVKMKVV
jgi:hypothetical protein